MLNLSQMRRTMAGRLTPRNLLALFVLLLALVALTGCNGAGPSSDGFPSIYDLEEVTLSDDDKDFLVEVAFAVLEGKEPPAAEGKEVLTEKTTRGVFVSHGVHGGRAIVSFSLGDNIMDALVLSAKTVKEKAGLSTWKNGVLKIDVMNGSGKRMMVSLDDKLKLERTLKGMIFDFHPAVALLPEELTGWNIVSSKKKIQPNNLKKYLKFQKRGRILADALNQKQADEHGTMRPVEVPYTTFSAISFGYMDAERVEFYRGKRILKSYTPETFYESAQLAGKQLVRYTGTDGRFIYSYRTSLDRESSNYNELRHCGTTYSMLELYEITGDEKYLKAAKRAIDYILLRLDGPTEADREKGADWLAIRGKGKKYKGRRVPEAKLGGAGLCLLMLSKYEAVTGDSVYREKMLALARFIEFMQDEKGNFASKYYYSETNEKFESLYYPGEAMLALVRFSAILKDRHWVDVAAKGMDYISLVRDKYKTPLDVEHDHWVMIAINELYRAEPREHYLKHLKKIGDAIMRAQKSGSRYLDYAGGFYSTPRSTPAATRTEGMVAGYNLLKHLNDPEAKQWLPVIDATARFQLWNQFTDENAMYVRKPAKAFGGMKEGLTGLEMRIDFSQHHISSMLGYYRILTAKEKK